MAVGLDLDGRDWIRRVKSAGGEVNGGGTMAGQRELAGDVGLGPTVHGLANRKVHERERREWGSHRNRRNTRRSYDSGRLGMVYGGARSKRLRLLGEGKI